MKILWVANISDFIGLAIFALLVLVVGILVLIAWIQDKLQKRKRRA